MLCYCPPIVADSVFPAVRVQDDVRSEAPRHPAFVRVTHWISALSFVVLVLSGMAILLAHPRLYWGETGAVGGPSLIDLPLPFVLDVPIRGPGRFLHFLAAWISVFTGLVYILLGLARRHFGANVLPSRHDLDLGALRGVIAGHLRFRRSTEADLRTYNPLQRLSYSAVVFALFPLMIWTGLGMSPGATSVFPVLATAFGGQQSARTIHFFAGGALILFSLAHVALVAQTGFKSRMKAMITGRATSTDAAREDAP